jgi:hypothetical protein
MKIKIAFTLLILAFTPGSAVAYCQGSDHSQSAMNCGDGKVLDTATNACVPVAG